MFLLLMMLLYVWINDKLDVAHAINYDMPGNIEIYTHSIRHVVGVFGLEKKNRRAIFELK